MPQRDDDQAAGAGRPLTTGEFRAAPDVSANTAQFRAFANDPASEAPWEMKAPARNIGRLAAIIVLVAVVLAVIAILVLKV
ncbi:MAG: hypothetical protein ACRDPO_18625 [Streptosporangiaceae bacterium]|jgi:hypothetical protein